MTKSKKIAIFIIVTLIVTAFLVYFFIKLGSSYIVTYDLDGGTMDEDDTRVWFDSEYVLPTPARLGYVFAGWYYGNEPVGTTGIWKYEKDVILKATWEIRDVNGIVYTPVEGGYAISGFNGELKEITVAPTTHNGIPVVGIEKNAFVELETQIKHTKIKYIKLYVPATVNSTVEGESLGGTLMVNRYTTIDDSGLIYLEENGEASVVGYNGNYINSIHIPEKCGNKPVTSIGSYAFYGTAYHIPKKSSDFFRIRIPQSVKSIGKDAFGKCYGVKAILYSVKNNTTREVIDKSVQFDWVKSVTIAEGNGELIKVISQILPAFEWSEYTEAKYYVRLNSTGGTITKIVEVKDENGKILKQPVIVKDALLNKNSKYSLPVPIREGYTFAGWYYEDKPVPQSGSSWNFETHIELIAKWNEK